MNPKLAKLAERYAFWEKVDEKEKNPTSCGRCSSCSGCAQCNGCGVP